jgi:preprotein translocase subunit SecD
MGRSWWAKFIVLLFFVGMAGVYVTPTVFGLDPEKTSFPFKQKINLGLDLQGGLYMVLGVDFMKVYRDVTDRQRTSLEAGLKEKKIDVKSVKLVTDGVPIDDPRVVVELDPAQRDAVYDAVKKDYWTLRLADESPGRLGFGLSREYKIEVRDRTLNQSIEVIRNRIDEFGVSEPSITSQGNDRIVVELPGVKEIDRAKELIGRTARLEFRIVNDKAMDMTKVAELVAQAEKDKSIAFKEGGRFSDYVRSINEALKGKIPEDSEIAFERPRGVAGERPSEGARIPYLLYRATEVSGDDLQDAQVSFDQESRRPNVSFHLNPRGATLFGKLTGSHIRERLAIVLDGIVHSAPVIQSQINANGQITLGQGDGDKLMKEAKDLAIVLRAGALPAQLEFLEERAVGPSLGQDSIQSGVRAGVVGCVLVFLFMMVYYRGSGFIAAVSLAMNGLFSLAILVGLEATLTLPGIAGLALTIGMAVDSNVLIFERIRDELREGKSISGAVEAGFQKAFSAIFDANITHGIVGFILMTYGTGPIRGFAVTLLVGIITTLFCAVTVCKLAFDFWVNRPGARVARLSI